MMIFSQSGRLGNQLFQYAALRTLCKQEEKEKLILLGFSDLQATFDGINASIINSLTPKLKRSYYYRLYGFISLLSQNNIVSHISDSFESTNSKIIYAKGLFKKMTFVKRSYFQSESLFNSTVISSLTIKNQILDTAKDILKPLIQDKVPIFVHIRRGDYLYLPNREQPAVLPATYYKKCIEIIKSRIDNTFFVFLSDDPFYVNDIFGNLENSYISQRNSIEDFALMTQCHGGILSASTFSWWAAYLSSLQNSKSIFLAPNYWLGRHSKSFYPPFIKSSFLEYVDV